MKTIKPNLKQNLALSIGLALLVTQVHAAGPAFTSDISITVSDPDINLVDPGANEADWEICVDNGCDSVEGPNESFNINMSDGSVLRRPFTIQNNARTDALRLNGNNVGMGTAVPAEELHIFSPIHNNPTLAPGNAAIRLESEPLFGFPGGGNTIWDINGGAGTFSIENASANRFPFKVSTASLTDSLVISSSSKVGVGTNAPETTLHVKKSDAKLTVEDTNGATASAKLIELKKAGIPAFTLTNTTNGSSWDFTQRTNSNFTLSKAGSGGFEMQITPTGDVLARGDVFARGIMLTSSRAAKTDFLEIKSSDVMKKLAKITVEEWRYKGADKKDRHISPMAEDFYSLFKLGPDNKHINPNDLASVAIIAAKELQKKADATSAETVLLKSETAGLKSENNALKKQLDEQKKRLASLEKLVTNIASSGSSLGEKGNKVALK